tara:strand:- start:1145 stop:1438 length:294 start_codon:yes stop_codon:yes gene_type:complete
MKMTNWSGFSKYIVLSDKASGKLGSSFTTFLNFKKVSEAIGNIAFSDKSTYSIDGNIYNRKITSTDAKNILENLDGCKWNAKTELMLLVSNQLKLRI